MNIESELQIQRDFLAKDNTKWVKSFPAGENTACVVFRNENNLADKVNLMAHDWLSTWGYINGYWKNGVINWNDNVAQSKEEVLSMLDKAIWDAHLEAELNESD